jgi:hypothetical protein
VAELDRRQATGQLILGTCWALFSGLFLALLCVPIYRSHRAAQWDTVPAFIDSAEVSEHSTEEGDAYEYRLEVRFHYQVGNQRHVGTRASFYANPDAYDDFHHDSLNTLRPYIGATTPFIAYVNPAAPSEAVLFPVRRWRSVVNVLGLGILAFLLMGLGLIALVARNWLRGRPGGMAGHIRAVPDRGFDR